MANKKSRFPSYGLVRGPSHEQGGVAGMVADEQPVELEGGEWIIPKEVVPDYLPVLKQITNEGRAIQKMDTGNTAMDALIASASLQTGLAQPKSPMYQEGGEVAPTWGERFVSRFPSRHQDPERAAGQQRALAGLIDFFAPQSAAEAGLMLAAGPIAGRVLKGAKTLPKLSRRAKEFIKKSKEGEHLEDFSRTEPGMAGPIDWSGTSPKTMSGRQKLEAAKGEYGRRKRLAAEMERYEAKYADEIAESLNPYDNPQVGEFMDDAIYNSGLDLTEALAARKAKFGYEQGGPVYQEGGPVEDYYKYLDVLKNIGKKKGVSIPEGMFTKGGGYTKEALASMYGITPETVNIDTSYYLDPSNVDFTVSGETASGAQKSGRHKQQRHLPLQEYVMEEGFKDPFEQLDWETKLQGFVEKAFPKGFPKVQKQGGPIDYYQAGGQALPRKQQEMRNPTVYGPPIELMGPMPADTSAVDTTDDEFQHLLNQLRMRDVNQNINPFTGDTIDTYLDSLRLQERMKKSKIPQSAGRKKARQGGPVMYQEGGMVQGGQALERRPSESMGDASFDNSLMGSIGMDRRVKPVDRYTIKGGEMTSAEMEIPKLSTAYLASFGMETPLSKRQQALLFRKGIAPQTLNPQVKGLINRALVQRLPHEED